jgi:hypothetical protein
MCHLREADRLQRERRHSVIACGALSCGAFEQRETHAAAAKRHTTAPIQTARSAPGLTELRAASSMAGGRASAALAGLVALLLAALGEAGQRLAPAGMSWTVGSSLMAHLDGRCRNASSACLLRPRQGHDRACVCPIQRPLSPSKASTHLTCLLTHRLWRWAVRQPAAKQQQCHEYSCVGLQCADCM